MVLIMLQPCSNPGAGQNDGCSKGAAEEKNIPFLLREGAERSLALQIAPQLQGGGLSRLQGFYFSVKVRGVGFFATTILD